MADNRLVSLGGREHDAARVRLGAYLRMDAARERLQQGVEADDTGTIADAVIDTIAAAIPSLDRGTLVPLPWFELLRAYQDLDDLNRIPNPERFAILHAGKRGRNAPWHYTGRAAVLWVHLIASAYHWARYEIEQLWPEEAVAYIEEILADDHSRREWEHLLSPVTHGVDRSGRVTYKPLDIPGWMSGLPHAPPKPTLLRRDRLPVGNIIYPKGYGIAGKVEGVQ